MAGLSLGVDLRQSETQLPALKINLETLFYTGRSIQ
jgi:hypothetical protein